MFYKTFSNIFKQNIFKQNLLEKLFPRARGSHDLTPWQPSRSFGLNAIVPPTGLTLIIP